MKTPTISSITFILLIFSSSLSSNSAHDDKHFLECLYKKYHNHSIITNIVYSPSHSSYSSILLFATWNLKFASDSTPKPQAILTPEHESQIPPIVLCAKQNDLEIRTRSGGHDFEGQSYVSEVPFVVIDLIKLSEITVDAEAKTAWVEAGVTLGSLYYRIAEKSPVLGFPGGFGPTVGVGGHISGGGYGPLLRKYGLAADNVIDARIVDAEGRIFNRKSMGEDLFWAIRGGGGASFCIIVAWKLQLVDVPERVTVFTVQRALTQNATQLVHRWQYVAPGIEKDLCLITQAGKANIVTGTPFMSVRATFFSLFLGGADRLLALMQEKFPDLGVVREDLNEMSWIQSVLYFNQIPLDEPEALLNRTQRKTFMKATSNYVQAPIPIDGLEGLLKFLDKPEVDVVFLPYGGRMAEIPESGIPFPHRAGNLYNLNCIVYWNEEKAQNSKSYISWSRKLYRYLTPYVLNSPRASYFNYRDLDIGVNNPKGKTSYARASIWGTKYFKSNFDRLVRVKTIFDPENFFKYEQSIPPLHSKRANEGD